MLCIQKSQVFLLALLGVGVLGCAPEPAPPEATIDIKEQAAQKISDDPQLSPEEKRQRLEASNKGVVGFGK